MRKEREPGQGTYPEEEAQRRFETALRAALNMPRKPHKAVAGKGREAKREATTVNVPEPLQARRQT